MKEDEAATGEAEALAADGGDPKGGREEGGRRSLDFLSFCLPF